MASLAEQEPQFLMTGDAVSGRRAIAFLKGAGRPEKPGILWLPGFMSDMASTKASALAAWAAQRGVACTRFDYSGHGRSAGRIEEGTIGAWLAEAEAILTEVAEGPQIVVGSSLGGWIALLLVRALRATSRVAGLVLIAPAWDMTERLMWAEFSPEIRRQIMAEGLWLRPSAYGPEGYPITRTLIEEGRRHLIAGAPFDPGCPVRILHGQRDADVPWQGSIELMGLLLNEDVRLTLVKDGEHRLSREGDMAVLLGMVGEVVGAGANSSF